MIGRRNPFLSAKRRPRIAAFAGHRYPDPQRQEEYDALGRLAEAIDAEVHVVHWTAGDWRHSPSLPRSLSGMFVPAAKPIAGNDRAHLEHVLPDAFGSFLALLHDAGATDAELAERFDLGIGCSAARQLRAIGVDLIVSFGGATATGAAFVVARLLDVPHVLHVRSTRPEGAPLALVARHAALVVASPAAESILADAVPGSGLRGRIGDLGGPACASRVASILAAQGSREPVSWSAAVTAKAAPETSHRRRVRPFVILCAERTGSNVLADLLRVQDGMACAGELFNPRSIALGRLDWIHPRVAPTADLLELRRQDPPALYARLLDDAEREGLDWIGFKLLYYHATVDDRTIEPLLQWPDLRVVHLRRADRLARFVSHERALATDEWFRPAGRSRVQEAREVLRVGIERVLTDVAFIEMLEWRYEATFHRRPMLELEYEEVVRDREALRVRTSEFFGKPLRLVPPTSTKTGRPLADLVENHADVLQAYRATPQFLGDEAPAEGTLPGSSRYYQNLDVPHLDYRLVDVPQPGGLTCRGPAVDLEAPFAVCIGAAQTFGRFVEQPFPQLLAHALDMPVLNAGIGGIGPRFFLRPDVLRWLNRARLVVVQVMSGRSAGNSRFDNSGGGDLWGTEVETGQRMRFEDFLERLVERGGPRLVEQVVQETRDDYVATMRQLGRELDVPTVLFWFSTRQPRYTPDWSSAGGIMQAFPQLLDDGVVQLVKGSFDRYVEVVGREGLPQRLWRASGPVAGADLRPDGHLYNVYYPSPEMHRRAAGALAQVCRALLS